MYVSQYGFILKSAVGGAELSDFVLFSLDVFSEIEGKKNSSECWNPEGEFSSPVDSRGGHGCSVRSLERQKKGIRNKRHRCRRPNRDYFIGF